MILNSVTLDLSFEFFVALQLLRSVSTKGSQLSILLTFLMMQLDILLLESSVVYFLLLYLVPELLQDPLQSINLFTSVPQLSLQLLLFILLI
mmetsp:Transcript_31975/g.31266  ORF Transcript_31975/g.31266 Transcript_31975/m.31266 type:complete len:92 (-) Transcript_31975:134-409(-)